jgi:hypothetical protein
MYADTLMYLMKDRAGHRLFNVALTLFVVVFLAWLVWYLLHNAGPAGGDAVVLPLPGWVGLRR